MKWVIAATLAVAVSGKRLSLRRAPGISGEPQSLCGADGFDSLNPGTQDYFNTISATLWTHPGNQDGFGVSKSELKCWFSRMIDGNCGGLQPNADRKKDLYDMCNSVDADYLDVWKQFSKAEFSWFKQTFPSDPDGEIFSQAMTTMKDMNTKEVLCTTLFVIDDGCVAFKYVKKA